MDETDKRITISSAVKPRSVIEGQLNFSAIEHKLFDILLSRINREDDLAENTIYKIYPKDYEKLTTILEMKDFYRMIRTAGDGLIKNHNTGSCTADSYPFVSLIHFLYAP